MECIFRIAQDGIMNLVPYLTKRIVRTKNLEVCKKLIMYRYHGVPTIPDEQVREAINNLSPGCFVLELTLPNGNIEALALHKFEQALSTMIPRENL